MLERSGADDDYLLDVAHFFEQCGGGNRLDGFAKAHVIGEHGAAAKSEVHRALFLIRIKFGGEHVEGAASAFDLVEEPFFLLRHFLTVLQESQMFAHGFCHIDEGTFAGGQAFDGGQKGRQCLKGRAHQKSRRIEVAGE